jgi:type IV pilus assembly protein PilB
LAEVNEPGINISTVEDPIEYDLGGVTQIQVNREIGLDFATVLRAFLRQDPDVLLVGETRDRETAKTVVEAALTGHLVFTTLHTNSAAAAFIRLFEMEVEPFLISSSTLGVIAQRLARKLCEACRDPYPADETTSAFFGLRPGTTVYRAKGCSACNGRGLRGRVGIYEVLQMTPALRALVARRAPAEEIHATAVTAGMVDLKRYAAGLLAEGRTSVEEVMQVVSVRD